MAEIVKHNIVIPLGGLTQEKETDGSTLGEETVNFYPDGEGYLVNYPGKTRYYRYDTYIQDGEVIESFVPDVPNVTPNMSSYTTPPKGKMTRIFFYRDSSNQQHIVFVMAKKLCVVEGNGYKVLHNFQGQSRDGACYPQLFTHNNFLIIANLGDPMLLWDGFQDVVPVGVTEAPDVPSVSVSRAPWYGDEGEKKTSATTPARTVMYYSTTGLIGGHFSKYGWWGNQGIWPVGPLTYEPGGHYHGLSDEGSYFDPRNWNDTKWRWRVRYYDRYGNLGPASAATGVVTIPKNVPLLSQEAMPGGSLDDKNTLANYDGKSFATVYWSPPKHDWHIAGAIVYKTLDLHPDKGNSTEQFYVEKQFNNAVIGRHTSVAGESVLSANSKMDRSVSGPPSTNLAASWGNRIVVRDPEFKERMLYSDPNEMGEFRSSNTYRARDTIETLLPLGDRLLVITKSTTEVLYYDSSGNIRHLETYEDKGTSYGPSFAVFGDHAFGLFNDGFFLFDVQKFTETHTPYYLERDYIDKWHEVQNSVVQGEWYFLSIRKELHTEDNNVILMCHLPTSRWFQVEESVRDMAVIGDYILGVMDEIYFLYRGANYAESKIHLNGLLTERGVLKEKTLSSMSILLEPTSTNTCTVKFTGSDSFDERWGQARTYPAKSTVTKGVASYPYWGDDDTKWHNPGDEQRYDWVSPNDFHIKVNLHNNITDFKHDVILNFSGPQRVKAISFEYSTGDISADKK